MSAIGRKRPFKRKGEFEIIAGRKLMMGKDFDN